MSLTYNGTEVQGVTYNGAEVETITMDGVVVWEAVKPNLEDNDWSKIIKICESGKAANYWNVGDSKQITLDPISVYSGWSYTPAFTSGGTYRAVIIGFNHNSAIEGSNLTHFALGKSADGTKDIAFCDSEYGTTNFSGGLHWDLNNVRGRNWTECNIYWMTLNDAPTAAYSYSCLHALPTTIRDALKTFTKVSYALGSTAKGGYYSTHSGLIDTFSEKEIFGARTHSAPTEADNCVQYAYYANGASKVRYKHNSTTTAAGWWTRSPAYNNAIAGSGGANYTYVTSSGTAGTVGGNYNFGVVPIFCL